MRRSLVCLAFGLPYLSALAGAPAPLTSAASLDPLDPGKWHEPTRARSPRMETLVGQLRKALLAQDPAQITSTVTALRRELGPEVSLPAVKPDYVGPPDATPRPADQFLAGWREDCARHEVREPWEVAAAALKAGRAPIRLRTCQRMADAYFATARLLGSEAGVPAAERKP